MVLEFHLTNYLSLEVEGIKYKHLRHLVMSGWTESSKEQLATRQPDHSSQISFQMVTSNFKVTNPPFTQMGLCIALNFVASSMLLQCKSTLEIIYRMCNLQHTSVCHTQ